MIDNVTWQITFTPNADNTQLSKEVFTSDTRVEVVNDMHLHNALHSAISPNGSIYILGLYHSEVGSYQVTITDND